jgi:hypothetical protein
MQEPPTSLAAPKTLIFRSVTLFSLEMLVNGI